MSRYLYHALCVGLCPLVCAHLHRETQSGAHDVLLAQREIELTERFLYAITKIKALRYRPI